MSTKGQSCTSDFELSGLKLVGSWVQGLYKLYRVEVGSFDGVLHFFAFTLYNVCVSGLEGLGFRV